MNFSITIGSRLLSHTTAPYCIAEIGINHNGSMKLAKQLIEAAVHAKADAVKFQTFIAKDVVSAATPMAAYQARNTGKTESQLAMLQRCELNLQQHCELRDFAKERQIDFLSTPHSGPQSVDLLEEVGVAAYKIGSGDLTNLPLLTYIAKFGRPMLLSTGMATMDEVVEAMAAIRQFPQTPLLVMHCTSDYPCAPADVNMLAMVTMQKKLALPVGYSDHTLGNEAGVLAVELGAACLEKHITLDTNLPGPDHKASMMPDAFNHYVDLVKRARLHQLRDGEVDRPLMALLKGDGTKVPSIAEKKIAPLVRKSLMTTRALKKGDLITPEHIIIKRPGTGIAPKHLIEVIGQRLTRDLAEESLLQWSDLTKN